MIHDDFRLTLKIADAPAELDAQREQIGLRDEIRCLRDQSDSLTRMLAHPSPSLDSGRLLSAAQAAAVTLHETVDRVERRAERASQAARKAS